MKINSEYPRIVFLIIFLLRSFPVFAESPLYISFKGEELGNFPSGWASFDNRNAHKIYSIHAEGGKKFIHSESKGSAVQIGYEKKWNLKEFPVLQWEWRAIRFPEGTNEREKSGNDSVLGLYIVFGRWPMLKAIKYIWSDTLPVGTSFNSPAYKDSKILVVRSGRSQAGSWIRERRDVLSDFHLLFGYEEKNPVAKGIAILTDSDNTNSHAVGDYGEFEALPPNGEKSPGTQH
jgi:hypothetical protein